MNVIKHELKSKNFTPIKTIYWLIIFTLFSISTLKAQVFPVNATPQVIPPYSLNLSNYSTSISDKIILNLLLTDITESNRQVQLKFYLENNAGISVTSNDVIIGANPIFLDGGVPLRLSNLDLQPYFTLQNLTGITPQQYSSSLPEGLYRFCFEVYDAQSGQQISRKSCSTVYLVLNDPPFLNIPNRGEQVAMKAPQNIIFQWTPRHLNATNVEYEFTLTEIWDTQIDPQAAFLASVPLYQTTTFSPTLLYGPAETALLPNKTYGWRVRAIVNDGISEASVFKNDGYSEIYHFIYSDACKEPEYVLAETKNTATEKILWQGVDHIKYNVQYRKKNINNGVWFENGTVNQYTTIYNLEAGETYEFRVGGQCIDNGPFTYSQIYEFTTPLDNTETSNYNCGITPEIVITNQESLETLVINDVFTAGDFPVTVKEVSAGNTTVTNNGDVIPSLGSFSGWGYIVVPYLEDTKLKVSFNNIQINTDYQLISGIVQTDYDENWGGINDIEDDFQSLEQLISDVKKTIDKSLQNGDLTQEEADDYKEKIKEAEEANNAYQDAEKALKEAEESGETEAIENAKNNLEETQKQKAKQTDIVNDIKNNLDDKENSQELVQEGSIKTDTYFDGVMPFNTVDKEVKTSNAIDAPSLYTISDNSINTGYFSSKKIQISENKSYIFSSSDMDTEIEDNAEYKAIKAQFNNLNEEDYLLWIHYDLKNNEVKYKVDFNESYYHNQIAQNELVQLYNSFLNYDFKGAIGSAIVNTAEYFDTLLLEFKDYAPFMNEEFLNSGYSTYELLQMVIAFTKSCGEAYTTQDKGLIPRCLWEQDFNPAIAYYAGFIDGAFETVELAWDAVKFFKAWNPTDPYFIDPNASKIRQQTIDLVLMAKQLDDQDILLSTIGDELGKAFTEYLDETVALTPQARYNQGKLIFEVVSFFFGVGEAKAFLSTGKITSKTLTAIKGLPKAYAKLIKGFKNTVKVSIKRIDDVISSIVIDGQEIAKITKKRLIILEKAFLDSLDENLQPIGQLIAPDGTLVYLDNEKSISDRVFDIIQDTNGKYKAATSKVDNALDWATTGNKYKDTKLGQSIENIDDNYAKIYKTEDSNIIHILDDNKYLKRFTEKFDDIQSLLDKNFPGIEIIEKTTHNGLPAIVTKNCNCEALADLDFNYNTFNLEKNTSVLNHINSESLSKLRLIKQLMIDNEISFSNLKVLISNNGEIYIDNIIGTKLNFPPSQQNIKQIDDLINLIKKETDVVDNILNSITDIVDIPISWFSDVSEDLLNKIEDFLQNSSESLIKRFEREMLSNQGNDLKILFNKNPELIDLWSVLDENQIEKIKEITFLEDFIKTTNKTTNELKIKIENKGTYSSWKEANKSLITLFNFESFKTYYGMYASGGTVIKFADKFSLIEEVVLNVYTRFPQINTNLLDDAIENSSLEFEKVLSRALDKITSTPGTYYRGIGKSEIDALLKKGEGNNFLYKNFLSTAETQDITIPFIKHNLEETTEGALIIITSKNGKHITPYSAIQDQQEVLHKSKSVFNIKKVEEKQILNQIEVNQGADPILGYIFHLEEL